MTIYGRFATERARGQTHLREGIGYFPATLRRRHSVEPHDQPLDGKTPFQRYGSTRQRVRIGSSDRCAKTHSAFWLLPLNDMDVHAVEPIKDAASRSAHERASVAGHR